MRYLDLGALNFLIFVLALLEGALISSWSDVNIED